MSRSGDPVFTGRAVVVGLVAGSLLQVILAQWIPASGAVDFLVAPAALCGAVAPVIAFRMSHWIRERQPASEDPASRRQTFLVATVVPMAIAEAAALFGIVTFALTRQAWALIGLFGLLLTAGALWPTPEKLEQFTELPPGGDDAR